MLLNTHWRGCVQNPRPRELGKFEGDRLKTRLFKSRFSHFCHCVWSWCCEIIREKRWNTDRCGGSCLQSHNVVNVSPLWSHDLCFLWTGDPLPLPSLRLLVPPLQLVLASMWRVLKRRDVLNYWTVADYVSLVVDMVPDLLVHRHRLQLLLGLRARVGGQTHAAWRHHSSIRGVFARFLIFGAFSASSGAVPGWTADGSWPGLVSPGESYSLSLWGCKYGEGLTEV